MTAVLLRNLIGDHFAGIEVEDRTDIVHLFVIGEIGHIADPNLIGCGSGKLHFQTVGFLLCMESHIEPFRSCTNAGEVHLPHELSDHFVADGYPTGFQNGQIFFAP